VCTLQLLRSITSWQGVLSQRQLMELSCDSLINRYLVVALQNAVFSTEFLSICKAVSIFTSVQSRTVTFSHCFFCLPIRSCKTFWMNFCEFIEQETVSLILEMYLSEAVDPLCIIHIFFVHLHSYFHLCPRHHCTDGWTGQWHPAVTELKVCFLTLKDDWQWHIVSTC